MELPQTPTKSRRTPTRFTTPTSVHASRKRSLQHDKLRTPIRKVQHAISDLVERNSCARDSSSTTSRSVFADYDAEKEPIQAYLRIRPRPSSKDKATDEPYLTVVDDLEVKMTPPENSNAYRTRHKTPEHYRFTKIFNEGTSQQEFFAHTTMPLVENVLKGQNGLIFAYGVTNSGKTYTIQGNKENSGILPKTLDVLFNSITKWHNNLKLRPARLNDVELVQEEDVLSQRFFDSLPERSKRRHQYAQYDMHREGLSTALEQAFVYPQRYHEKVIDVDGKHEYAIWVSYCEIYNEKIYDLLDEPIPGVRRRTLPLNHDPATGNKYVGGLTDIRVKTLKEAYSVLNEGQKNRAVFSTLKNNTSSRSHGVFTIKVVSLPIDNDDCVIEDPAYVRHSKLTDLFRSSFTGDGKAVMVVNVNPYDTGFDENSHVMKFSAVAKDVTTLKGSLGILDVDQIQTELRRKRRRVASPNESEIEDEEEEEEEDEDTDPFVSNLLTQLEDFREKWIDAESRCAKLEYEIREQVVHTMEEQLQEMENRYMKMLQRESALAEEKAERKMDLFSRRRESTDTVDILKDFAEVEVDELKHKCRTLEMSLGSIQVDMEQTQNKNQSLQEEIQHLELKLEKDAAYQQRLVKELMQEREKVDHMQTLLEQVQTGRVGDIRDNLDDPVLSHIGRLTSLIASADTVKVSGKAAAHIDEAISQLEAIMEKTDNPSIQTAAMLPLKELMALELGRDPYQIRSRSKKLLQKFICMQREQRQPFAEIENVPTSFDASERVSKNDHEAEMLQKQLQAEREHSRKLEENHQALLERFQQLEEECHRLSLKLEQKWRDVETKDVSDQLDASLDQVKSPLTKDNLDEHNGENTKRKKTSRIANSPLFSEFCRLLASIARQKGTEPKRDKLTRYIQNWRSKYGDFFDAMRLLLPAYDKERTTYGMKEQVLAKTYVEILGLSRDSEDADQLIHWRMPGKTKQKTAGDFAEVAYEVIRTRSSVSRSTQTVADLNLELDKLSISSGKQQYNEIIRRIFLNYTAEEQKWIIRIVLKELKIGMSENSALTAFHPDAVSLFNNCSNLRKVCAELRDPFSRLVTNEVDIFHPVKPQLAHKEIPQDIPKAMGNRTFLIQQKLDGERIQLHIQRGEYRYWSRRTTDYTELYGKNKDDKMGSLTQYIHHLFLKNTDSLILDGEMVAYDPIGDQIMPFGTLKTAAKDTTEDKLKPRPCYIAFDILYCNGASLVQFPLQERVKLLPKLFTELKGFLQILPSKEGSKVQDVIDAMDNAIMDRHEGIVIKNPGSPYRVGERNKDWIKVKPEYVDTLGEDLDLLIIGGEYGTGRRSHLLSHFLLAVRDSSVPSGSEPKFLSFCKVGTGYSIAELTRYNEMLAERIPYNPSKQPSWLMHSPHSKEKPDVLIPPYKSLVVQVKAAEITTSGVYAVGYTLRFPRFVRLRDDKSWEDCTSTKELMALRAQAAGRLQGQRVGEGGITSSPKRRKVASSQRHIGLSLMPSQIGADTRQIKQESVLFENMSFAVINGDEDHSKEELEILIKQNGGNFYQHEDAKQGMYVLAGDTKQIRVKALISKREKDIIRPQWIVDCIQRQDILPLQPKYMVHTTLHTAIRFRTIIDESGDSYVDDITDSGILELFKTMPSPTAQDLEYVAFLNSRIVEKYLHNDAIPGALMNQVVAWLDDPGSQRLPVDSIGPYEKGLTLQETQTARKHDCCFRIRSWIVFQGGQITQDVDCNELTHIILEDHDEKAWQWWHLHMRGWPKRPHVVSQRWVIDSVKGGRLIEEALYQPIRAPQ
ncbi:hypothetical protein BZG36_02293 [Bifiguratus adelaidae]|uniref:DNA ligase n=1 Tax=Bifiguratus adelaidae TaxID=1938954 RepID=A0A261Y3P1_9FUNG|nr:hypothetical protein BZG36_02293 [Bifiguratus adelaidae]